MKYQVVNIEDVRWLLGHTGVEKGSRNRSGEDSIRSLAMMFIKIFMILIGVTVFLPIGRPVSLAASEWLLMSRHGECEEIQSLNRKVPDLGDVRDPTAFISLMRDKGYQVTVNEVSMPNGKVAEVKVTERELFLMLVAPDVCQQSGRE